MVVAVQCTVIKITFRFLLPAKTPLKTKPKSNRTTNFRKAKHVHEHLRMAAKTRACFHKIQRTDFELYFLGLIIT